MKNQKKVTLRSGFFRKEVNDKYELNTVYYKFTEFLTNGDLVTYKEINVDKFNRKSVILIYDSKNWKCNSIYELNEKEIIFGEISNNRLWMLSNKTMFILNLFTFQYRKVPLEISVSINRINFYYHKLN